MSLSIQSLQRWAAKQGILLCLLLLVVLGAVLFPGSFLTTSNIGNIMRVSGYYSMLAIGMTFVILTGGIDLSVGSVYAITGVVAAYFSGYGWPVMIACGLLVSFLLGLVNGILVAYGKLVPFIATLATMMGYRGVSLLLTPDSTGVAIQDERYFSLSEHMVFGALPLPFLLLILFWVAAVVVLGYTAFGRHIYATGGNVEAAAMIGINVRRTTMLAYAICGLMAGMAGLIVASRGHFGQSSIGSGIEMETVAAVVLGGAVLSGGIGRVTGSVIGMFILRLVNNLLNLQGSVSFYLQNFITGILVLAVVIVQSRNTLAKQKREMS